MGYPASHVVEYKPNTDLVAEATNNMKKAFDIHSDFISQANDEIDVACSSLVIHRIQQNHLNQTLQDIRRILHLEFWYLKTGGHHYS